jgi:WD40 repeat protein
MIARVVLLVCLSFAIACTPQNTPDNSLQVAHKGLISAAFSPEGDYLFTGSFQHGGALWNHETGERLYNWNLAPETYSAFSNADFSEDGKFVATTDGQSVTIWDVDGGGVASHLQSPAQSLGIRNTDAIWASPDSEAYWQKPGRILDLALSRQYLLLGLENQVALLVDITSRSIIGALPHADVITSVAMDQDAQLAVTGSRSGVATLWSLETGAKLASYEAQSAINFVAISANGEYIIVCAATGPVQLIETRPKGQSIEISKGNPGVTAARFDTKLGQLLLGTSRERVMLFNLREGVKTRDWTISNDGPWHKAAVIDLAFTDTNPVAVASNGRSYHLEF